MSIKRRHEEHENHERWLVSYADFITLLFAFFVVLYATSNHDEKKQKEFEKSIKQYMGFIIQQQNGQGIGEFGEPNAGNKIVPSPFQRFPDRRHSPAEIQQYVEDLLRKKMNEKEYDETVSGVSSDAVGVRIQLTAASLFPSGSANLKESAFVPLGRIGKMLKESGRKIIIEGHTDDLPIRSAQFPSNWELSSARASKIVRYLVQIHKINPKLLAVVAHADQKPLVKNDTEENRARNRRIEVLIVNTGEEADEDSGGDTAGTGEEASEPAVEEGK